MAEEDPNQHLFWASPNINWFDYFVDRKSFTKVLDDPTNNREKLAKLAVEFSERAITAELDERQMIARALPPEDVQFAQRKAACLWLCSMACFAALQWDFDFLLDEFDVVTIRPLIDYLYRIFNCPDLTTDASFAEWILDKWTLSIDRRFRIPPPMPKQTVHNPAVTVDQNLLKHEAIRKVVVEFRERISQAVQSTERLSTAGKAIYVPGVKCFFEPFMNQCGMSLEVGLTGLNVLCSEPPKPQLILECSLLSAKDVSNKAHADLITYYFADGNFIKVRDHLKQMKAPIEKHALIDVDIEQMGAYAEALRVPSSFPKPKTNKPVEFDQKLIQNDSSLDRLLSVRRERAVTLTTAKLKLDYIADNYARDLLDDMNPSLRPFLREKSQSLALLKALRSHLTKVSPQTKSRIMSLLYYFCATIVDMKQRMRDCGFSEGDTRAFATLPQLLLPQFPDIGAVKACLISDSPFWNFLLSYDVDEIKRLLPEISNLNYSIPVWYTFSELFSDLYSGYRSHDMNVIPLVPVFLGKMQQLVGIENKPQWQLFCNAVALELMPADRERYKMLFVLDVLRVSASITNDSCYLPWRKIDLNELAKDLKVSKTIFGQQRKMPDNSSELLQQVFAMFLNGREYEYLISKIDLNQTVPVCARLLAAVMGQQNNPANLRTLTNGWNEHVNKYWEVRRHTHRRDRDERHGDREVNRELMRQRLEFMGFIRLIKEPTILSFLISYFAFKFNHLLILEHKQNLLIHIERSDLFPMDVKVNERERERIQWEAVDECLKIVISNALDTNPTNSHWLRAAADYKYAKSECADAANLYTETLIASNPLLIPPFSSNDVINDTLWSRLRICLHCLKLHTLAVLVCQFLTENKEEQYVKGIELIGSQVSYDTSADYAPMVFDHSLVELLSKFYEQNRQYNHVDKLLLWASRPSMSTSNRPGILTREQNRRAERLLRVITSQLFGTNL